MQFYAQTLVSNKIKQNVVSCKIVCKLGRFYASSKDLKHVLELPPKFRINTKPRIITMHFWKTAKRLRSKSQRILQDSLRK